jgi:flagellar basal-body rod protein FlgF/flagellar basal-body rod protein FlgG
MPHGLYLSADGVNVQSKRLEMLSNNLANVDTVGFKRELALFQARGSEAQAQGLAQPGDQSLNDISGGVRFAQTVTDFSQSPLKHTGNDTDAAILGDGFFQIEKDGERYLTRAGNFSIDSKGRLVTQEGESVLSSAGTPITVDPDLGSAAIGDDGSVYQFLPDGRRAVVSDLAIVRPGSNADLVKRGENRFFALAPVNAIPPEQRQVRAGFLEGSGVQSTQEMMQLIEASRALEMNVNMIRNQDQMLGGLVSRVLRQS